jgi:hypothetical protein
MHRRDGERDRAEDLCDARWMRFRPALEETQRGPRGVRRFIREHPFLVRGSNQRSTDAFPKKY